MFERQHHVRIASVLRALDPEILESQNCLFGGGTAVAMRHGEYRESVDIDFLVSDLAGYRTLRQLLTSGKGLAVITRSGAYIDQRRAIRADQYGLRTLVSVAGVTIKIEIIYEARIVLEPPNDADRVCEIATLTQLDFVTSKLLANSDRWADTSNCSRDLVDLAMMRPSRTLLRRAIAKASGAYGASIETDLSKAIEQIRQDPQRLDDCMRSMKMTVARALLWKRIRALSPK